MTTRNATRRWPCFSAVFCALLLTAPMASYGGENVACSAPQTKRQLSSMTCRDARKEAANRTFVLSGKPDQDGKVESLTIQVFEGTALKQTITEKDGPYSLSEDGVRLADYNFDGHVDLSLALGQEDIQGNAGSEFWLYNSETKQFEVSKEMNDKLWIDPTIDAKAKTLEVGGRSSCCSSETGTYHWVGKHLRTMERTVSGSTQVGRYLSDVLSLKKFANSKENNGSFCGDTTYHYNDEEKVTSLTISTDGGGPCSGSDLYLEQARGREKSSKGTLLDGALTHGNVTDIYKKGLLLSRTVTFNPPKTEDEVFDGDKEN